MVRLRKIQYGDKIVEYDADAPCRICGEPVIGASMGGVDICPACDCGVCRYCKMKIVVFKEKVDDGKSKQELLDHMGWHHENTPDVVSRINAVHRDILDSLENRQLKKVNKND